MVLGSYGTMSTLKFSASTLIMSQELLGAIFSFVSLLLGFAVKLNAQLLDTTKETKDYACHLATLCSYSESL